ncbi:putative lipoprotein [Escherichia phage IMM-001]|nr:putative lipoprotein [Escherichia phage IMM-001]
MVQSLILTILTAFKSSSVKYPVRIDLASSLVSNRSASDL